MMTFVLLAAKKLTTAMKIKEFCNWPNRNHNDPTVFTSAGFEFPGPSFTKARTICGVAEACRSYLCGLFYDAQSIQQIN